MPAAATATEVSREHEVVIEVAAPGHRVPSLAIRFGVGVKPLATLAGLHSDWGNGAHVSLMPAAQDHYA